MFSMSNGESLECWALRDPSTKAIALSTVSLTRAQLDALRQEQRVRQPHATCIEPVEVVITIAAKPEGR